MEVVCVGQSITALIDTGASISVMSTKAVTELGLDDLVEPWNGPGVLMANGERGIQIGAVDIAAETCHGPVSGKILVMKMDEVKLLVGIDLLSQLGRIIIDFPEGEPGRLLSELPVNMLVPEDWEENKLIAVEDVVIHPRVATVVAVKEKDGCMEICWDGDKMIVPAKALLLGLSVSTGNALYNDEKVDQVIVTNFTCKPILLPKGEVVCHIETADGLDLTHFYEPDDDGFDEPEKEHTKELLFRRAMDLVVGQLGNDWLLEPTQPLVNTDGVEESRRKLPYFLTKVTDDSEQRRDELCKVRSENQKKLEGIKVARKDKSQEKETWDYFFSLERDMFRARHGKSLTLDEQETTIDLLWKHGPCIATNNLKLGWSPWKRHKLDMGDAHPINQMPYKSTFKERSLIEFKVERNNHVLAEMLNMYVSSDQSDWDIILASAKSVINTSVNESTGFGLRAHLLYPEEESYLKRPLTSHFSESTWTLACPVWINQTDGHARVLKDWATKQLTVAKIGMWKAGNATGDEKGAASEFRFALGHRMVNFL